MKISVQLNILSQVMSVVIRSRMRYCITLWQRRCATSTGEHLEMRQQLSYTSCHV